MSKQSGYFRYPTIHKEQIVFVSEDDLWSVSIHGGNAVRLTSNLNAVTYPLLSPDGQWIAYIGREDGNPEIYVMPAQGGVSKRLTYTDSIILSLCSWSPDGKEIIFSSSYKQPFWKSCKLFKVSVEGGLPQEMNLGIGHSYSFGPGKQRVLGRNTRDIARWKRYRGGTAGKIWIDAGGRGHFKRLDEPASNFASPMWIGKRIYFISDHEGIGNIYSVNPKGEDIQKHTQHTEYYVRNANSDGEHIVYQAGGDLYTFHIASGEQKQLDFNYPSPRTQRQRKYVDASKYLQGYAIHPKGHSLLVNTRGKVFEMGNWEGPVYPVNNQDGVRKRLPTYFHSGEKIAIVSDEGGQESIEIFNKKNGKVTDLTDLNLGRVINMAIAPNDKYIAVSNHRLELFIINVKKKTAQLIDKGNSERIEDFEWAPDSRWLAYSCNTAPQASVLKIYSTETGKSQAITTGDFIDRSPTFDPKGKYLYFISHRIFNPVYDQHYFDVNFPKGMRPYLIALQKDAPNPFIPTPKTPGEEEDFPPKKSTKSKKVPPIEIDFDGIQQRIAQFPVAEGDYHQIKAINDRVFYTYYPVKGSLDNDFYSGDAPADGYLLYYDFEKHEQEDFIAGISHFDISPKSETLIYQSGRELRVLSAKGKPPKSDQDTISREGGWIDVDRVKVSVVPPKEWKQIFNEIWRLQKQQFWVENMSGVDWDKVHKRYFKLIEKVSSRAELSDIAWEMQGELGTSHAYEIGGDYRRGPQYYQGLLGADFIYDAKVKAYQITHIVQGDQWIDPYSSPLARLGVQVHEGDWIVAVNGEKMTKEHSPYKALVNQVGTDVVLTIKQKETGKQIKVTVRTLGWEQKLRYREWVEKNRQYVHEQTNGEVGYVHLPNMGPEGYAEFHRYYATESDRKALIVDVRYNGGGHVSQLILEKLARKRIGYDLARWGEQIYPYPSHSIIGPIVALTNEYAGSDGDIFSHCFKLMGLGKLIGRRTWGGVIGIWPRHHLIDGGVTTQPEFSFWFPDVGFGVENYGTEPHIDIDISPQDWKAVKDPQMDRAIAEIKNDLKQNPPTLPDFGPLPDLSLPS